MNQEINTHADVWKSERLHGIFERGYCFTNAMLGEKYATSVPGVLGAVTSFTPDVAQGDLPKSAIPLTRDFIGTRIWFSNVGVWAGEVRNEKLVSSRPLLFEESEKWLSAFKYMREQFIENYIELDYNIGTALDHYCDSRLPRAMECLVDGFEKVSAGVVHKQERRVVLAEAATSFLGRALYCRLFVNHYDGLGSYYWLLGAMRNIVARKTFEAATQDPSRFASDPVAWKAEAERHLAHFEIGSVSTVIGTPNIVDAY